MVATIEQMLAVYDRVRTIATVGASTDPAKPAHSVPVYLQRLGYEIIPVNPNADEIFGVPAVASLADIEGPIDLVQVFRPAEEAPDIARAAIEAGASVLWLQLGIESEEAARIAEDAGLTVVMNACMRAVHMKYLRTTGEA
jgi:predicted CoA-binding protein